MPLETIQVGGDHFRKTKPTKQTGNHASRVSWKRSPMGRTALCGILSSAHHLGFTDLRMSSGETKDRPDGKTLYEQVLKLFPWLPEWYEGKRETHPQNKPFGYERVACRLRHMFRSPGGRTNIPKSKRKDSIWGRSDEHPMSNKQVDNLRIVWERCSEELTSRLRRGKTVSIEEAITWGTI